ncbi:MAG TPA: hypothetical protein VNX26_17725 [Candidatus Acidoferrum sp.]|jgi:hypothetical protein|nr:hypothetical protein [Candidatus Acidoferrum sp.]
MSIVMMHSSISEPSPRDIATLLQTFLDLHDPSLDLLIACESYQQANSFRRYIRSHLEDQLVDPDRFNFTTAGSSAVRISLTPAVRPDEDRVEVEADQAELATPARSPARSPAPAVTPQPVVVAPQTLPRPTPETDGHVPEGDFKVIGRRYEKVERAGRYLVVITWEVLEGPSQGKQFQDKVLIWPPDVRAQHFARAVNAKPQELAQRLDSLIGIKVWDRRRDVIREDGTALTVNHYYPPEWTPPPNWH